MKTSYDTLHVLDSDKDNIFTCARQEAIRIVRILTVLREYISECDSDYHEERMILPMSRFVKTDLITCNYFLDLFTKCEHYLHFSVFYPIFKSVSFVMQLSFLFFEGFLFVFLINMVKHSFVTWNFSLTLFIVPNFCHLLSMALIYFVDYLSFTHVLRYGFLC